MTLSKINNINTLIVKAQNGDISARTQVLDFAVPLIQRLCENGDIQNNSVLKIAKYLRSFDVSKGYDFLHWVSVIVKNEKRKALQKKSITFCRLSEEYEFLYEIISKVSAEEFELDNNYNKDFMSVILDTVEELKPAQKQVFKLYCFDGLKHTEISEVLGVHEGTSKSNLNRARMTLKLKLKQKGYEFD